MREIKFRGHNGIEWLYESQISIMPYGKNVHCFMPNEKINQTKMMYVIGIVLVM